MAGKSKKLNFAAINAAALARFEALLRAWLPGGKKSGAEYSVLNPMRSDGRVGSFKINTAKGVWQDFATGEGGGDPVSLFAYLRHNNDQGAAARELGASLGILDAPNEAPPVSKTAKAPVLKRPGTEWRAIAPPDPAPEPPKAHIKRGWPKQVWTYYSAAGKPLGYSCRFTTSDGGKEVLPLAWCRHLITGAEQWRWMAFPLPRWLYGLNRLAEQPDKTVLVVEGEKCADAAALELPELVCITWAGGGKAVDKADWTPLAGRKVIIWPDCDAQIDKAGVLLPADKQPGLLAARKIAGKLLALGCTVWLLYIPAPGAKPGGWDVADAIAEGLTGTALAQYVRSQARFVAAAERREGAENAPPSDGNSDGCIDELNLKHAILPMGGKILILNRDYDPVMDRPLLTFSMKQDFETRYCNRRLFDKGKEVGLGTYWLNHGRRAEFDGMVFSPGLEQPGYLNLWTGWGVEPKHGACQKYLEFVFDIICSGDQALYNYIIYWCAHLLQRPQELPETALVFRGREGAGKNTFVDPLRDIVGRQHFLMLSSLNQITGRFSGHLANALLVFCNESVWGGDKPAQGVLKSMITDDVQPIEHKGRDLVMVKSYRRMIFATNENWAVPRGVDDRRYVVTDVADQYRGDFSYFNAIREELKNGGTAALMAYLLAWDLDGWHPRDIPQQLQLCGWELKIRSGGSIVQWWFDILHQGWLERLDDDYASEERLIWPECCLTERVQKSYLAWCLNYKITHPEHSVVVGCELKQWGVVRCRLRAENIGRQYNYKLPLLEVARAVFSKRFSIPDTVWKGDEECG